MKIYMIQENGNILIENNLAETIGLTVSYKTYQINNNKIINDFKLPGFEIFDKDKLFFISFAMVCEKH